jgi:hypothetical protein
MELYEDDYELFEIINFGASVQVVFYYLMFLFFVKWYFKL